MQTAGVNTIARDDTRNSAAPDGQSVSEHTSLVDVSVVCPFYNEGQILEPVVTTLLEHLDRLEARWELIIVNDGSTDDGGAIAEQLAERNAELSLVTYPVNRGRGYALRQGIARARGDVIITTEIDLSWGEHVVERLYHAIKSQPDVDIVIASPHLPGGGYKNVPGKRVFLSRLGNRIIRTCMSNAVTMNTGMTRAYRRDVIRALPLEEDRKEFHLEVVLKAQAFGYRLSEIPCVLEWKAHKHQGQSVHRKSSTKVNKLVVSHMLFSLFANPIRYVWGLSALSGLFSLAFLIWGVVRFLSSLVSVYVLIISLSFGIIALMFFTFGVIAQQGNMVQRELWTLKQEMRKLRSKLEQEESDGPAINK
ncbi:MAG: glycosyltransferase family 2 protein [Phycisphaerae bacterium]|jgi:glycosyltransferase involved in cell wall biosynthesis